ncbi:MAG: hypothetical protein R2771_01175 [Saprospiraceae bacterium]
MKNIKKYISVIILILFVRFKSYSCSVCAGDFTDGEILAYGISIALMIFIMFVVIYLIYKKISNHYDLD